MGRHHDDNDNGVADQADPSPEDDYVDELGYRHTGLGCTAPACTYPDGLEKLEAPQ